MLQNHVLRHLVASSPQRFPHNPGLTPSAFADPCNAHGICQTNNTCFCGNGYASCAPQTGLQPLPGTLYGTFASSAGCETDVYNDVYNCGHCNNVRPLQTVA